jgi:hypothetical protein
LEIKGDEMKRQSKNLASSLEHRLGEYALAASAAGVGVLALAQSAEAKIVYTKAHIIISPYWEHSYAIDLNHDGKTDFVVKSTFQSTTNMSAGTQRMIASGANGNGVQSYAAALKAGKPVGSQDNFAARGVMASDWGSAGASTSVKRGPWVNVKNRYLGLKFKIKNKTHYGWARLTVQAETGRFYLVATLTGYAYETIPNKPIIAGKTHGKDVITLQDATLGHLAQGSSGLSAWRRKVAATH